MTKTLIDSIDKIYHQTTAYSYKTLEQYRKDFEKELNVISEWFQINALESIFLTAIIINNTEYKNCQLEDIAVRLEVSKFEVLAQIQVLFTLRDKKLIEINEWEDFSPERPHFLNQRKYPIDIMNKNFSISKIVEDKLLIF